MKKYLISNNGNFYKANLHCHTNVSDGKYTPEEIKQLYSEQGYSVVAFTDHEVFIPHNELTDNDFVALNACEISVSEQGKSNLDKIVCHMCMIALNDSIENQPCWNREKYVWGNAVKVRDMVKFDESKPDFERDHTPECINSVIKEFKDCGFFVTYNHPTWSLENYNDYTSFCGMHALEIYNSTSYYDGYFDYNDKEYDDMLRVGKRIFCISADDNHGNLGSFFGGFTMIKAPKLTYDDITNALLKGDFYASQGPEIYDLWFEDGEIHITCSPAKRIVFTTAVRKTGVVLTDGSPVTEGRFKVLPEYGYVRITVEDSDGKRANTNAYFTDELFK